jgi:hypothetical protein
VQLVVGIELVQDVARELIDRDRPRRELHIAGSRRIVRNRGDGEHGVGRRHAGRNHRRTLRGGQHDTILQDALMLAPLVAGEEEGVPL